MRKTVFAAMILMTASAGADETKESERARSAAEVLDSIMVAPDKSIPMELLAQAEAVAVIPNVVKGAFLAGGRFGRGLVAARGDDGEWGTPSYIEVAGGSIGLQIGVEATDLILVFTEPDGLREMLKDNLKLGVDAAAVAGPVGRHLEASSNVTLDSPIYAYSRNKGVFAGISLDGTVLTIDDSANQVVYGPDVTGTDIIIKKDVPVHASTKPLVEALNRHSPPPSE